MGHQQLTYRERYLIGEHKSSGQSVRTIARLLHRRPSTISRELRRNADSSDGYDRVAKADRYARAGRWRSRQGTQFEPGQVELVHELMRRKWSLEQISRRLRKQNRLSIGTTTIYRWLRRDKAAGGSLWLRTRQLSKRYRKGYRVADHRGRMAAKTPISQRPCASRR